MSTNSKNEDGTGSPRLVSYGNSYIDRYMADNITIHSNQQRSSSGASTSTHKVVFDSKFDHNNGRPRLTGLERELKMMEQAKRKGHK